MEDLNKSFDKEFYPVGKRINEIGNTEYIKEIKSFIRQREKELLEEVTERIEAYKISGKLPEEEQRINDLLDEIIEEDIKELSNE